MTWKLFVIIVVIITSFNIVRTLSNGSQISESNLTVHKEFLFWQRPIVILLVPQNNIPNTGGNIPNIGGTGAGFGNNVNSRAQLQRLNQRRNAYNRNGYQFNNRFNNRNNNNYLNNNVK